MLLKHHHAAAFAVALAACTLAEPAQESLSGADLHCPTGHKVCGASCVRIDQPSTGCESLSCDPCAPAHASAACVNGACGVGVCEPGWSDCDRDPANGCEEHASACSCRSIVFTGGAGEARIPASGMDLGDSDWTLEAWIKHNVQPTGVRFVMNVAQIEYNYLYVSLGLPLRCGVGLPGSIVPGHNVLVLDAPLPVGEWHHVACERSGGALRVYIDGYVRAEGLIDVPVHGVSEGALLHDYSGSSLVGPMRLSRVARYGEEFVPRMRWIADQDAVLLYLVKSGINAGSLVDEAGGDNHALILGGILDGDGDTPCAVFGK